MRLFLIFLATLAPFASQAVVATTSHTDPAAADSTWAYVGRMNGASAVAVAPDAVLTAGHVLGGDFVLGGATYRMASTTMGPVVGGRTTDLRIVHLLDSLPGWYDVAPSIRSKANLTMVGYGGTGVVNATGTGYDLEDGGVRRAGMNALTNKANVAERGPSLRSLLDRAGESVLAGGDSGGGWFVDGRLVGISSFVYTNNAKKAAYGFAKKAYFGSGAVDLTNKAVQAWLAGQRSRGVGPNAPQAVPEPGSFAGLLLGGALVGKARRRKG